MMMMMMRQDG